VTVGWPAGLPVLRIRFARPTDPLEEVVAFYRVGLSQAVGLPDGTAGSGQLTNGRPTSAQPIR
jgi:hypothetical protein